MKIELYNSLTRQEEELTPIQEGSVSLYTCGPTVYGPGHLGHSRSYVNFDLLKRVLLYNNLEVKHVLNITDVHDSMIDRANELNITIEELAEEYIPFFYQDLKGLNTVPADHHPRVTEYIPQIIEMVQSLIDKDLAYTEDDGSVYFKTAQFKEYGKLSGIKLEESKSGTRVQADKHEKEEMIDFALWKGAKEGEPSWDAPWGKGRPGWHIECSAMIKDLLGDTIDIHAGGLDLKFPHHENEIAQSESVNNTPLANMWIHGGMINVDGVKMSKSLGNYTEIQEVSDKGYDLLALRYLYLIAHYRSPVNFTWDSLEAAQSALHNLRKRTQELKTGSPQINNDYRDRFLSFINNDLDIPQALALTWDLVKDDTISQEEKYGTLLDFDRIFGLQLDRNVEIPQEVLDLVSQREELRKSKEFSESDEIREKIEELGWEVEDTEEGSRVTKKNG